MRKSKNKGFSLIELIVVIAILVVFAAVLIPSIIQYTENSRAQKDASAMDEVVNAFQLALADEQCFDEMLKYSCTNNYLTYSDSSGNYGQQINDGEFWAPDGSGRATTITFNPEIGPDGKTVYKMESAIVNDMSYGNGSDGQNRIMEGTLIDNNQCYFKNTGTSTIGMTYAAVKQSVGDTILNNSQTYRNSSFTVFIRFTQKDGVTVADVYGSFNGTNVYDGAEASKGSGTSQYDENNNAITTLNGGKTDATYTQSSLSGSGNFGGSIDYKSKDNFEQLSKDYEFHFYSSVKLAADDINTGNIGSLADVEKKEDAVVGVYIENNMPIILLLKDTKTSATVTLSVEAGINLNGHAMLSSATYTIKSSSNLKLIGNGGVLSATYNDSSQNIYLIYSGGKLTIDGGTYAIDNQTGLGQTIGLYAKSIIINDAEIDIIGGLYKGSYGVYANEIKAYDSTIKTHNPHSREITNATMKCYAVIDGTQGGGYNELINCDVYSSCYTVAGYCDKIVGGTCSSPLNNVFINGTNGGKEMIFQNVTFKDELLWRSPETQFSWFVESNVLALGGSANFKNYDIYIIDCFFNTPNLKLMSIRLQGANGENSCNIYLSGNKFNVSCQGTKATQFISSFGASAGHHLYVSPNNTFFGDALQQTNFYHLDTVQFTNEIYKAP